MASALIFFVKEEQRSQYSGRPPGGLGAQSRAQLSKVLRASDGTLSPRQVAEILDLPPGKAARLLSRWAAQGWVARVRRGLYVPVPLEGRAGDAALEDPWLVAERLFSPCYIGGWSAAEHWGLTEQIFRSTLVLTVRKPRDRSPTLKGARFQLRTVNAQSLFGLKAVWRGRVKVSVSDPARTVVDMLVDPRLGGGLRGTVDTFRAFLDSKEWRDVASLVRYARRLGNGAVIKRMGFLLETYAPEEAEAIAGCRAHLSKGNARLDPGVPARRLVTAWRLWVPDSFVKARR